MEEKKGQEAIAITNKVKDARSTRDYEITAITLYKLEKPTSIERNKFLEEGKKLLQNILDNTNSQFRDIKWLSGSTYGTQLTYYAEQNKVNYRQHLVAKLESIDMFIEYNLEAFFEDEFIVALAEAFSYKDISSSFASDLRAGKESFWELFYSSPTNIEYTPRPLTRKNAVQFNLSLIIPRHYLRAYFDEPNQTFVFTPNAVWDDAVAKDKKLGDIKLKLVKKLAANETFSAYTAPIVKQSVNNKLNDPQIKGLNKNIPNVLICKEMYVEDPRRIEHPYYPAKYIFEWNKSIYELSGDVSQHELLRELYASISPMTGNSTAADNSNQNTEADQLIEVMNAWLTDFFVKNKQSRLQVNALLGAGISRYSTDLKFGNFQTFLQEEGVMPVEKRYWMALIGSYNTKEEAVNEMKKWIVFMDNFKTNDIELSKISASATGTQWKVKILNKEKAPESITKLEIRVEQAEILSTGGVKHEVYIKIGSSLNL
ncbi:MAG: hypothetical protein NZM35_03280 [Chitinophagales bacterium]|nr:hypothetical protein [Chitinophagales bacterium]